MKNTGLIIYYMNLALYAEYKHLKFHIPVIGKIYLNTMGMQSDTKKMLDGWKAEYLYIISAWVATIIALVLFIPKKKLSVAICAFLGKQFLTWLLGLVVVQLDLIEYPVRLFPKATMTSFDFEFFIYPCISAIFIVNYPENKSTIKQLLYYAAYCTGITILEVLVEQYTHIIEYKRWHWYVTWLSLFATFYINKNFVAWLYKRIEKEARLR